MKYLDLAIANEQIKTIDIKGKEYSEVNQRIKAFRMVYPQGSIQTKMISNQDGVCIFEAHVYTEEGVLLGTGTAYEKEDSSFINKTSYIENCETSAVGRALGMAGFGIDVSIASAEEMQNAIQNQEVTEAEALNYELTFGKYKANTLKEVYDKDKEYIKWMLENTKDERMIKMIELATGEKMPTEEETKQRIQLKTEISQLEFDTETDHEDILKHFKVKSDNEMTIAQLEQCKMILQKKLNKKESE